MSINPIILLDLLNTGEMLINFDDIPGCNGNRKLSFLFICDIK
jgi:hypothetical protein